jgi:hypothetical protein
MFASKKKKPSYYKLLEAGNDSTVTTACIQSPAMLAGCLHPKRVAQRLPAARNKQ